MAYVGTFSPSYGSGIIVAPGTVTASSTIRTGNDSVCLTNTGSVLCFVRVGPAGTVATTADYPVPPLAQVTITKFQDHDTIAYITQAGTAALHVMTGTGF